MKDILTIFNFNEFKENQLDALLSILSCDEKKVFNILKSRDDALTPTQIYELYIDKIIDGNAHLKKGIDKIDVHIKNKKPLEVKAEFARKNNVTVPTNRTITRVLENLKDIGFLIKRKPVNKKAKAYYGLQPKIRYMIFEQYPELQRKKEIEQMIHRVKQIKTIIKEQK